MPESLTDAELDEIQDEWNQCGACDAGLPTACTCSEGDPRIPVYRLITEIRRLRRAADNRRDRISELLAANEALLRERNEARVEAAFWANRNAIDEQNDRIRRSGP